eukprot:CAMPEP_0184857896 /NCGR_PEP_ID=MMETSP0580-20130426/3045_1 /TAXON_ID=1118495 /ORGANISM="Dactyliosolen fragilissimus" /LENGTH=228 /DNA_ID=CAMNT_0027353759 /DNA_START=241 /DNA_END=927 /DNA_ORIENTATION=-
MVSKKKAKGFAKKISQLEVEDEVKSNPQEGLSGQSSPPPVKPIASDALARLRLAEVEKRDAELRKIRELKQIDSSFKEDPNQAVIPEVVAMRMGKRMLPFVGLPLFGGMGAFVAFWYFATYKNLEFQPALVAFTTIAMLAIGLVGITYSIMSASWDPENEGSTLGFEEIKTNLGNIKAGLQRSRDNVLLREKMAGLPEDEIQNAIKNLDKKEEKLRKSKMGLAEKIDD